MARPIEPSGPLRTRRDRPPPANADVPSRIAEAIEPLPDRDHPAWADAFDRYADCRVAPTLRATPRPR